jgi:hypothetical protein
LDQVGAATLTDRTVPLLALKEMAEERAALYMKTATTVVAVVALVAGLTTALAETDLADLQTKVAEGVTEKTGVTLMPLAVEAVIVQQVLAVAAWTPTVEITETAEAVLAGLVSLTTLESAVTKVTPEAAVVPDHLVAAEVPVATEEVATELPL